MISINIINVTEKLPEFQLISDLLKTSFPTEEQVPIEVLVNKSIKPAVEFKAYYERNDFCGITYTIENDKYLFLLYIVVNSNVRSKGYGSKIIQSLTENTSKIIVLNVEDDNPNANNYLQRKKRIDFYNKNNIFSTGCSIISLKNKAEPLLVLSSDVDNFDIYEYINFLNIYLKNDYSLYNK